MWHLHMNTRPLNTTVVTLVADAPTDIGIWVSCMLLPVRAR